MHEITELLKGWSDGDTEALDSLIPLVDLELRKIAHNYMRKERPEHILQTTALVHEALIRLIREHIRYDNRKQFYALIARRMRQVLVDYARKSHGAEYVDIDDAVLSDEKSNELIMLNEALTKLATIDERQATIVECHYFIGLTHAETAELLGIGKSTVDLDLRLARAWLKREMKGEPAE
jgi:RNA polymerase sigma factor (TIGR02999 family)